jgi:hypothetical protein
MNNAIDIKTENGFLELDKANIRFNILNDIFSDSASPGFYSFPFAIPGSPINHQRLNYAHLPENATKLKKVLPVELYSFGQFKRKALLYLEEYKSGLYDANVLPYSEKILGDLLETNLRDLDLGVFNEFNLPEQLSYYFATFVFEDGKAIQIDIEQVGVYNNSYTVDWNGDPSLMITELMTAINADTWLHDFTATIIEGITNPSLTLNSFKFLLKGNTKFIKSADTIICPLYFSYTVHWEHLNEPNGGYWNILDHMKRVVDDTTLQYYEAIFGFSAEYRFPLIYNPFCYGVEKNPARDHLLNYWHFSLQKYLSQSGNLPNYPGFYSGVCPCVKLRFLVESIFLNLGYQLNTQFFEETEYEDLILIGTGFCDNFDINAYDYRGPQFIDLRKALPNNTIKEFLDAFKKKFNLKITYDHSTGVVSIKLIDTIIKKGLVTDITAKLVGAVETISFDEYDQGVNLAFDFDGLDAFIGQRTKQFSLENIKNSVADFASLPATGNEYGDVRLVAEEDKYYFFDIDGETLTAAWQYLCDNLVNFRIGDFKKNISTALTPVIMQKNVPQDSTFFQSAGGDATNLLIKVPAVYQMCKAPLQRLGQNDFGMKLAFYRGLQDNDKIPASKYPMASHDDKDCLGAVVFDKSLKWDGANGLYENNHKEFINFMMNTSKHQAFINYTSNEIFKLNGEDFLRIEASEYLFESVDVVFDNSTNTVKPSKIIMYKR